MEDLTLWEYFSYGKIMGGFVIPLLFFDQLEEMFTRGKKYPGHVNAFVTEIADLIENRVPVSFQEKMEQENKTRIDIEYIELIHDVLTPILKESRNNKAYELATRSTNLVEKDPTLSFRL